MKKLIIIFIFLIYVLPPAFAQGKQIIKAGVEGVRSSGSELVETIGQKVAPETIKNTPHQFPLHFVNFPVQGNDVLSLIVLSQNQIKELNITSSQFIVQAQKGFIEGIVEESPALNALDWHNMTTFRAHGPSMWRGMGLNLQDLKHILIFGLEVKKTQHRYVYATKFHSNALEYAANRSGIPVIVRMHDNRVLSLYDAGMSTAPMLEQTFYDIPAPLISEMLAWLKIGKESAWYNVVLNEEGKLVFSRAKIYPEDFFDIEK